jgi:multidrug transporter EmrE-like cation transporter
LKGDVAKNLMLILGAVLLGVVGQLSMKHGMSQVKMTTSGLGQLISSLAKALTQPFVTAGFLLYGVSALAWLVVLSRVELSYAYPMVSVGYVAVVILSRIIFHEHVTAVRILGTLVICAGVFLISRS